MKKLLQNAHQHAVTSAPAESQIDDEKYLGFTQKNPVWSFYSMSQAEYLSKSKEERVSLISRYYTEMSNGENNLFFNWPLVLFLGRLRLPFTSFFLFVIATSAMEIPKKANMLYLSKEATTKHQKLKMQMLLFTDDGTKNIEFIWKHNAFFGNQKGELTLFKRDFP